MSRAKVYKYSEGFGRMGNLEGVFVASAKDIARLRRAGQVYLGEVLGKHSEVVATINDETVRELTDAPAVVSFLNEHCRGCIGVRLADYLE